jgi:hypothetical protein
VVIADIVFIIHECSSFRVVSLEFVLLSVRVIKSYSSIILKVQFVEYVRLRECLVHIEVESGVIIHRVVYYNRRYLVI